MNGLTLSGNITAVNVIPVGKTIDGNVCTYEKGVVNCVEPKIEAGTLNSVTVNCPGIGNQAPDYSTPIIVGSVFLTAIFLYVMLSRKL